MAKKSAKTATAAADAHGRVAAWLVLAGMGGTSLCFNIFHAAHAAAAAAPAAGAAGHAAPGSASGLALWLAVLYGVAPVGAAMGLSHIAGARAGGWLMRLVTLGVMLGAMGLSVGATATVVAPVAPGLLRYVFPFVMDAAALVALQVILAPPQVASATSTRPGATSTATGTATNGGSGGGATSGGAGGGSPVPPAEEEDAGDDGKTPGKRGEIRRVMRAYWDSEIAGNRIPNGADLNRSANKDPDYSLGKRYASEWRRELQVEMVSGMAGEWDRDAPGSVLPAGAAR